MNEINFQAQAFIIYYKKVGGNLQEVFEFWSRSKDFSIDEKNQILTAVITRRAEELPLIASPAHL